MKTRSILTIALCILSTFTFTTARAASVGIVDLGGQQFGHGVSVDRNSSPTKLDAQTRYFYRVEGTLHGTGALVAIAPNGTPIADFIEFLDSGASDFLEGFHDNPTGTLPFTFLNQSYDHNFSLAGGFVQGNAKLDLLGEVLADGTIRFQVKNVSVTIAGANPTDKIVFEAGARAVVGIPPEIEFTVADAQVNENDGTIDITVQRTVNTSGAASVKFATKNGTAKSGKDYVAQTGTLNFADGETQKVVTIAINDNALPDADREFTVELSNAALGAELGDNPVIEVTIINDEPSPLPYKGTYYGLIDANPFAVANSGIAKVTVAPNGKFTASMKFGGKSYTAKGPLNLTGSTATIAFSKNPVLDLVVTVVGLNPARLTGVIRNAGNPVAAFTVVRSDFTKIAPFGRPGRYNVELAPLALVAGETAATRPIGRGWGIITVSPVGGAKIVGKFADGTAITHAAAIAPDGSWPFYLSLYKKTGLAKGTFQFRGAADTNDCDGSVRYVKGALPTYKLFPAGFDTMLNAVGSIYVKPPKDTLALAFTDADIDFTGGNLAAPLHIGGMVSVKNVVTIDGANAEKLKFKINASKGTISGSFFPPGGKGAASFTGVLLQKQIRGAGYFLGKPADKATPIESGEVTFKED